MAGSKAQESKPKKQPGKPRSGSRPPAAQQAERNAEIVAAKARGLSWSQIAPSYGLSIRRCKQIYKEWRESNPPLRTQDPVTIIDDLIDGYLADIEELVLVGATTTSDNARVGAVNSRMSARQKIAELLQAVGVLPHDLGSMRVEIDARVTAQRVIAVLNQYNVSDEVMDALMDALENAPETLELEEGEAVEVAA